MSLSSDSLLRRELEEAWEAEVTSSNISKDEVDVASLNLPEEKVETSKSIELAELPDFSVEDEEMISLLVQKETEYLPGDDYLERYRNDHDLIATARRDAISWMHQVQVLNNLRPLTVYLSVNYLDRFLSTYHSPRQLPLLCIACVSLAVKMEEKVPLTELQVGGANFDSEAGSLYRMEFQILTALNWRLFSITPFNFIHYLLHRLKGTSAVPQALISRTTDFIINTTRVLDFSVLQPSSIAAASVMCACEKVLQTESADCKEIVLSSKAFNKEKIISCYNLMQQLVMDNGSGTNKISSGSSHSPIGVQEAAARISGETTQNTNSSKKRKICETLCTAADQQ